MNVQDVDRILAAYRARLTASGTVVKVGPAEQPGPISGPPAFLPNAASAEELAVEAAVLSGGPRDAAAAIRPVVRSVDALDKIAAFLAWSLDQRRSAKLDLLATAHVLEHESRRLSVEIGCFIAALRAA